ncbi:Eukaryotic translation initiation factor 3 subunit D [Porphyridium purpureum]|uniref:Eukaryotic translation initiation factor 3 subunit D n=1 Tax=Porphyridium purpureum TaxID=35688 RepID=A0A5J4YMI6_PORPP|nr:Eukaryotic translation initiation factor 3 subunit D [Porphyridium purpureum]KAA8492365.1 Eukaryotic translation initiation factor 3 subunit D [Porphyridium purpureum]|eukprot:POR7778..scf251_18
MEFKTPVIHDNPQGFGPPLDLYPDRFVSMPYAPFSKSDRLGRAADWFSTQGARYPYQSGGGEAGDEVGDDGGSFTTVDQRVVSSQQDRRFGGARGGKFGPATGGRVAQFSSNRKLMDERGEMQNRRGDGRNRGGFRGGFRGGGYRGGFRGGWRDGGRWEDRLPQNMKEASVTVGDDWEFVAEISYTMLSKARYEKVVEGKDLLSMGKVNYYDKNIDRVNTRAPRMVEKFPDREFHYVTTTDDPIIRKLASQGEGNIFATSSIISLLMTAPRSSFSWDIVVQRVGDKLFFDKREGSMIDFLTVGENNMELLMDERNVSPTSMNNPRAMSLEATALNQNFSQSVLRKDGACVAFPDGPDPLREDEEGQEQGSSHAANIGYKYRKWEFPDNMNVVVRCEVDAALEGTDRPLMVSVKSLCEHPDSKSQWRTKLDAQRGAIFATEIKNNAGKLARFTAGALLADVDQIKFGFCTRANPKVNTSHQLLSTQTYKPREFAAQIALTPANMWGVFIHMVRLCYRYMEPASKAVILKDPNEPIVRMYRVPEDAFDEESDDEEEQGEGHASRGVDEE